MAELKNEEVSRHVSKVGKEKDEPTEKIDTRAASSREVFESKLYTLFEDVLRNRVAPGKAVGELHRIWQDSLTSRERDELALVVIEIGARIKAATDLIVSELPALIAAQNSTRSIG